ncbi:hypothetical protein SG34_014685 [Thalassomonas viridans]|uniref:Uncharacterized protein n=1 Tax=Thalassomonas viridans TaxID=137584 RepID=A0AAF0CDD7_9GAMM|nr:hypothetical protein [Thalassomonas viridans]WDE08024.1 hypothetical protein SG34_014685 [Thalassomonas viridans]
MKQEKSEGEQVMGSSADLQCQQRLELSHLLGTWVNVNSRADFIARFALTLEGDALKLTLLSTSGACEQTQLHLDVHPVASPGSELATGFYHYRQASGSIFAANEKNGVLVLQSYRQQVENQKDNLLTREFYYREASLEPVDKNAQNLQFPGGKTEAAIREQAGENIQAKENFQALAGNWHNTYRQSRWMKAFAIEKTPSAWELEVFGDCNGVTWPKMTLTPYSFDVQEMGFVAYCDLGSVSGLFCAYSNKGLIVVSVFFAADKGGPGQPAVKTFCREFYAKPG